ncbi:MAG TPA: MaoC family dehydratase [Blastocatellia bacterium]|nr:MaoC family dehydratase [Blastocatellia bacterium]
MNGESLYRVRARNTSADSENRIHDAAVAEKFGFRGGLVPGVTVYGYMTVPIVARFGMSYLERGSMQVRFHQPFYEGDQVTVRAEADASSLPVKIAVTAEREGGTVCATGHATVDDASDWLGQSRIEDYPRAALPAAGERPVASSECFLPGSILGTVSERIDRAQAELLESIEDPLPVYYGADAVAHPAVLLSLSNQILMQNYRLGPWIHAASDLINLGAARADEVIEARGRVRECFERKGHEFVVYDVLLLAGGGRVIQRVRHTAIFRPKIKSGDAGQAVDQ